MKKTNRKPRAFAKVNFGKYVVLVSKSNKNILAQILEPETKRTLTTIHSQTLSGTKTEQAQKVGEGIGNFCKSKGLEEVVFYRSHHPFCGRVQALADSIKKQGIKI